jgi:hypothetical protein
MLVVVLCQDHPEWFNAQKARGMIWWTTSAVLANQPGCATASFIIMLQAQSLRMHRVWCQL